MSLGGGAGGGGGYLFLFSPDNEVISCHWKRCKFRIWKGNNLEEDLNWIYSIFSQV